jgi:TusA-related sulfurtransferase
MGAKVGDYLVFVKKQLDFYLDNCPDPNLLLKNKILKMKNNPLAWLNFIIGCKSKKVDTPGKA